MNNQVLTDNDKALLEGLNKAAETLRNTVTTVQVEDVAVTITAEPKVIDIRIGQSADINTLSEKLRYCFNEAFRKSTEKVLEQAAAEL